MAPKGQESFKFEEESFPSDPVKKSESAKIMEMPNSEPTRESVLSVPKLSEGEDECQYCGAVYENENSCRYCASNYRKKDYLKKLAEVKKTSPPLTKWQIVQGIMERMRNDPRYAYIKDNNNALRAKAEIIASTKPGTNYETTPYPPLDN